VLAAAFVLAAAIALAATSVCVRGKRRPVPVV